MLTVKEIQENIDNVISGLEIKNHPNAANDIHKAIELDKKRKLLKNELDSFLAESKLLANTIGKLYKEGKTDEANVNKEKTAVLKKNITEKTGLLDEIEVLLHELLVSLPNPANLNVPKGNTAADNEIIKVFGQKPEPEVCLPHWEIAEKYNIIDFERGNLIAASGFPLYKEKGARLQRALITYFLDKATEASYKEYQTPLLVNETTAFGTGQLPDKEGQMYFVEKDGLYLIPTAEVPLTNIYRDTIFKNSAELPVKLTAYTPCFRREAGSYGKDVRGLNRLHQFDKVEIVQIVLPNDSYKVLDEMTDHVAHLLEELGLHYRIAKLCGGDLGFASAITYDFEVYSAAQKRWLEVSSVSNFGTFQSNRLKIRLKEGDTKAVNLHTLNGSALALPRILAALLENNQTSKGIEIPEVLWKYTGFKEIVKT